MRPPFIILVSTATIAVAGPIPLLFGDALPVQTLIPRVEELIQHVDEHNTTLTTHPKAHELNATTISRRRNRDSGGSLSEGDESSQTDATPTLSAPAVLFRRAARNCGVWKIDCAKAREACNNACFFQNCVHGGTFTYKDGGGVKADADENRVQFSLESMLLKPLRPDCVAINPSARGCMTPGQIRALPTSRRTNGLWQPWSKIHTRMAIYTTHFDVSRRKVTLVSYYHDTRFSDGCILTVLLQSGWTSTQELQKCSRELGAKRHMLQ